MEGGLEVGIRPDIVAKQCCAAAYVRGAFLGSGFIANPRGDFHFEITVESESLAEGLVALLADTGIKARIMQRREARVAWCTWESGNTSSQVLAFVGAHQCALQRA